MILNYTPKKAAAVIVSMLIRKHFEDTSIISAYTTNDAEIKLVQAQLANIHEKLLEKVGLVEARLV